MEISPQPDARQFRALQDRALELASEEGPLRHTLDQLMLAVEQNSVSGVIGSILLLDDDGNHMRHGAGPSLPDAYNAAIDGIQIGSGIGSCGTAAAEKRPVYVADIAIDPLWEDFRDLALAHGLRACWSTPFFDRDDRVLGTFAMYYREPREPLPADLEIVELVTRFAALIVHRDRATGDLAASEERLRLATEHAEIGFWDVDIINDILIWPPRVKAMFGISPDAPVSMADFYNGLHPEDRGHTADAFAAAADPQQRALYDVEYRTIGAEDGVVRCVAAKGRGLFDRDGQCFRVIGTAIDVTERKDTERRLRELNESLEARVGERTVELEEAHEALRQSQKMEAVGQLTGGIAHDFNNMLAVVIGSLDLLERRIGSSDSRAKRHIDAAAEGARRAANLTQRLLAFSRQQPLKPETISINRLVAGMSDLLEHSLGGDIRLETVLAGGLWQTDADPNQLENVILNLAINARDAMSDGGRVTIETQNAHLDPRYAAVHLGVPAGQYVMVAVSDTGTGMPPEVIDKAFDPFFTTKEVGKGTGLGLSQVYGFVKQSGGHVKIYSEPGHGTTVKVYLPRVVGAASDSIVDTLSEDIPYGDTQELILVVEDEPAVRQFSVDALGELGYRVIEADGAAAALRLLEAHPDIAMMFTDVVMPDMNGAKLAEAARAIRPDLKILFTTGYTRNAVVHNGVLDAGVQLIGKPFTIEELAGRVRQILDIL